MNTASPDICLNRLISEKRSFAAFRLPGQHEIQLVSGDAADVSAYQDIRSLNRKAGFVIAPFHTTPHHPVVLIEGGERTIGVASGTAAPPTNVFRKSCTEISPAYARKYQVFMEPLRNGKLEKLVLSRSVVCRREKESSPAALFLRACLRYTYSYVYLCYTPLSGMWLGCTPEILLSGDSGNLHTVALAGTKRLRHGELPAAWDAKNTEEQRIVARYIQSRLAEWGVTPEEEGPYAVRAGGLAHLRSDFRFALPGNRSPGDLLHLLHPTPAVCGLPEKEAYRFILEHEGYDRKYYSGFIGMLDPENISNIYVNLRCMNVEEGHYTLYTGGGLLPSSTPEEEWMETEDKLLTLKAVM